ncbi:MAG: helix-turn-helix transcriptional regulator [Peptococcaceae bacterium]|nr:helix-turn-helix transcriptional regulator [Peptococcaceae bacterium]MBO5429144.1 helix-turn-helix transcriptional regulator [Peptococcaceae bacterium]MBP3341189.1 helix-turn-helix transcriptional regulator [Peptococcaceae bacterium]MBP3625456.1 helix-turn-helix transcriptional regulator [Peptococcaceae bacterium]
MKFGDILRELLDEKDITQAKLAEDLNLRSSTVGHYVRNEREPDFELLKSFSAYFHVSIDYLLGNTIQDNYQLTADEQNLLRKYRTLEPEQKELCLYLAQGLIQQNQKKER